MLSRLLISVLSSQQNISSSLCVVLMIVEAIMIAQKASLDSRRPIGHESIGFANASDNNDVFLLIRFCRIQYVQSTQHANSQ